MRRRPARRRLGREQDRLVGDVDVLDWLKLLRCAELYDVGKANYLQGGLNLASLTDVRRIEAEDDERICVRRRGEQEAKPKKRQRKILPDDDE